MDQKEETDPEIGDNNSESTLSFDIEEDDLDHQQ